MNSNTPPNPTFNAIAPLEPSSAPSPARATSRRQGPDPAQASSQRVTPTGGYVPPAEPQGA